MTGTKTTWLVAGLLWAALVPAAAAADDDPWRSHMDAAVAAYAQGD